MKKIILLFLLLAAAGGIVFAQAVLPTTMITGTLEMREGWITLRSGNITYYCRNLDRYTGFIEGLKAGAQVTLEGYVYAPRVEGSTERMFQTLKATVGGRTYEIGTTTTLGNGFGNGYGYGAGCCGGYGCGMTGGNVSYRRR